MCRKKKGRMTRKTKVTYAKDNTLMLFGTSPGDEAEQMLYLDAQIQDADGVTTLTEMHDEATKAIDAGKQTPDRNETVKDIILRHWKYGLSECSSSGCVSTFSNENEFITCSRCIVPICSRCEKKKLVPTDTRLRIYCDNCCKKFPKPAEGLRRRFV